MRQLSFLAFLWAASAQSAAAQQFDPAAWRAQTAQWLQVASADHLSPVGMYMAADWVVKAVMLSLVFASVVTWAILPHGCWILRGHAAA